MEIILNSCYGGFGFSEEFTEEYMKRTGETNITPLNSEYLIERTDIVAIEIVKELGELANCSYSELVVAEIPDGSEYYISDYDGIEALYYGEKIRVIESYECN